MVDRNIKTDYDKLQMIADIQHLQYRERNGGSADGDTGEDVLPLTEELAATGRICFDLVESFPADAIPEEENFRSLFHYYGILSMAGREEGQTVFKIPNVCVERQLFGYLRRAYRRTRTPSWLAWGKLASALAYRGEWKPFLERLAADLKDTQPVRGSIDREIRIQAALRESREEAEVHGADWASRTPWTGAPSPTPSASAPTAGICPTRDGSVAALA